MSMVTERAERVFNLHKVCWGRYCCIFGLTMTLREKNDLQR